MMTGIDSETDILWRAEHSIPNEAALVGIEEYREKLIDMMKYKRQGVPMELRFYIQTAANTYEWVTCVANADESYSWTTEDGDPVILDGSQTIIASHMKIGNGNRHAMHTAGVHPNEIHSLTNGLYDIEDWARNAYRLQEKDLTVHYYCFNHQGIVLNDLGLRGMLLDPVASATYTTRSDVPIKSAASWGHTTRYPDGSWFYASDADVLAFGEIVKSVIREGGLWVALSSGHNSKLGQHEMIATTAYGGKEYGALLEFILRRLREKIEEDALMYEDTIKRDRRLSATVSEGHWDTQGDQSRGEGGSDATAMMAFADEQGRPRPTIAHPEFVNWTYGDLSDLQGMTEKWAYEQREIILDNFPKLIRDAGEILAEYCEVYPATKTETLMEDAFSVTGKSEQKTWIDYGAGELHSALTPTPETVSDQPLSQGEVAEIMLDGTFYPATRAGQVFRALRKIVLKNDDRLRQSENAQQRAGIIHLANTLETEMKRIIATVWERGKVTPEAIDESLRMFFTVTRKGIEDGLEKTNQPPLPPDQLEEEMRLANRLLQRSDLTAVQVREWNNQDTIFIAHRIARFFGADHLLPYHGEENAPQTFVLDSQERRVIFFNIDHPAPLLKGIGHAVLHVIKEQSPDTYRALCQNILPYMQSDEIISPEEEEEIMANLVSRRVQEASFWQDAAPQATAAMEKLGPTAYHGAQRLAEENNITPLPAAIIAHVSLSYSAPLTQALDHSLITFAQAVAARG